MSGLPQGVRTTSKEWSWPLVQTKIHFSQVALESEGYCTVLMEGAGCINRSYDRAGKCYNVMTGLHGKIMKG